MAQQQPQPSSQRATWQRILDAIRRQVIEPALKNAYIDLERVDWTYMRWDALDIEAAWPEDEPQRNVHAWLTGDWPRYTLNFEGAAWQDDRDKLKRRVAFFGGPASMVELQPPWDNPQVDIRNAEQLASQVNEQVIWKAEKATLDNVEWKYDLKSDPRLSQTPRR